MRSSLRPKAEPLARFVAVSVAVHLTLMLALPPSLFEAGKRSFPQESETPSETVVLTVLDLASEALLAGNYSLTAEARPAAAPQESMAFQVELADTSTVAVPPPEQGTVAVEGAGEAGGTGRGEGGESEGGTGGRARYEAPVPVIMMWPSYPASARRRGIKGTVVVRVHVTSEGSVDIAEVQSGLEDQACRQAALDAARALRFLPATLGGRPVDAWFSYPVEFGRLK